MEWKRAGFKNEEDYKEFLDRKLAGFFNRINRDPKLVSVFKRMKNK